MRRTGARSEMEALAKAILDGGPPFYLAAASILLNIAQAALNTKLLSLHLGTIEKFAAALALSTKANEASFESQDEMLSSATEHHHVQMLTLGKLESVLANIQTLLTKIESLITLAREHGGR